MYTKGKWTTQKRPRIKVHIVSGKVSIATTGLLSTLSKQEKEDNAERICLTNNSHDALVKIAEKNFELLEALHGQGLTVYAGIRISALRTQTKAILSAIKKSAFDIRT